MRRAHGFTLVELLVVLVILGALTGMAVLGSGMAASPARQLNDEAERLAGLLRVLLDEAVLDNREYGVRFERQSYQVLRYEPQRGQWQALEDDARVHGLPDWVELSIELDEQALTLPSPTGKGAAKMPVPQLLILSSGELSPFRLRLSGNERGGPALLISSDGFSEPLIEAEKSSGKAP
ncbi:type II secretion system minor pseudopilin GspH [Pseudomonas sp. J452]|uniref:type II secretion system minor pseudopilin GspH n=1 Tax=Pseudomonas sp. J452 TaxID=2898441 RepID=UPI0021ADC013|nr:type II secretion system minor pseudopilin GspH [Pseudomonas sp. J452]UUY07826.1 type II secretion system minor pseudopilin GspH [Pseudomonas sp. J452]